MNSHNTSKINQLLRHWPRGTVAVQPWLHKQHVYRQLADAYCKGGWMKRIGEGAYIQLSDKVDWTGGLFALQTQLDMQIHIAALTALEMQGYAHYLPLGKQQIWLFKNSQEKRTLPRWFLDTFASDIKFRVVARDLFKGDKNLGLTEQKIGEYNIFLSSPERAIMEYFDLVPQLQTLEQGFLLIEGLSIRPTLVQQLLECCTSIKVKRLFMHVAEHAHRKLPWFRELDLSKVYFGKGKRLIEKGGRLDKKYNLSLPPINEE